MNRRHPLALFNGSYLGPRPTGIGVVARDLVSALDPDLVPLLVPEPHPKTKESGTDQLSPLAARPYSIPIPADLSPAHGSKGHLRRLLWTGGAKEV